MAALDPTNVTASVTATTAVKITWENAQVSHTNNKVEYLDVTGSGTWTTASAVISPSATEYEVTGLSVHNEYRFRVQALDGGGDSAAVASLSVWTWPNATGLYFAAYAPAVPEAEEWTHVINLTRATPFLNGTARSYKSMRAINMEEINPNDWRWGPELTEPAFVS